MIPKEGPLQDDAISNYSLLLPYLAPYFTYVGIASLSNGRLPLAWSYTIQILVVSSLLLWAWTWYIHLSGPRSKLFSIITGIIAGLVGTIIWILLLIPFVNIHEGHVCSTSEFYLRIIAAALIVPVFEELCMRGYIFRVALQWDKARKEGRDSPLDEALDKSHIEDVAPGEWSIWAVTISTIAFTIGHNVSEWPAAVAYGLLMSFLWINRKDLISCIVAHGTTNLALAVYVQSTGQWGLW